MSGEWPHGANSIMQVVYVLLLALFISMVLVPPLSRLAGPLGLTDKPDDGRKIHTTRIPRVGGIAIVAGSVTPILLWVPMGPDLRAFMMAVGVLFVFGVLDDRFNLDYRLKLLGQALAALIVTLGGGILIQTIPFLGDDSLSALFAVPLTVFVLVGLTNAVNLSDGLDGLAGGISLLALGGLSVLAWQGGNHPAFMVALAMMGATFGFLRFNTNPAQIFMGDTGSQFLGFGAGVLAIMVTQREDSAVGRLVPLLILGLPVLDTLTVMVRRIVEGRSPFAADRSHLHHRLLNAGLSQPQAVTLIYAAQSLLILLAWLLRYSADAVVLGVYLLFAAAVLFGLCRLVRYRQGHALRHPAAGSGPPALDSEPLWRPSRLLRGTPFVLLSLAVPATLFLGALVVGPVSRDIGSLAGILLVPVLLAPWLKPRLRSYLDRLTLYVVAVVVVYLVTGTPGLAEWSHAILALFAAIGVLTAIWVRFAWINFQVTSLDLLILLIALVVPSLADPWFRQLGMVAVQSIILFYAIEVLMAERNDAWGPLRLGVIAALAVLTCKGLWCV